ncbi:hypothetical protein [Zavarzinella formosa]|uniref:hypothetical protein n=1 Tax=Zavarzinella formosa TaxID=360055 RepID=UPI0002FEBB2B|nr:hypothetical protein [Zavarzinella formosa]
MTKLISTMVVGVLTLAMSATGKPVPVTLPNEPPMRNPPRDDSDQQKYHADAYIDTAGKLRAAGKDRAVEILRSIAGAKSRERDEEVIILCRMLFTARPEKWFHRPALGAPVFMGGTNAGDWPLEPVEIVDGVPFIIVRGYELGGRQQLAAHYLDYCLKECDWGAAEFKPKTGEEKKRALDKLLASPKWKTPLDWYEREFLSLQIK